jgi:hypothetical protein
MEVNDQPYIPAAQNRKKECPNSVTELLRLEEKRFVQGVSYFINKIPVFT